MVVGDWCLSILALVSLIGGFPFFLSTLELDFNFNLNYFFEEFKCSVLLGNSIQYIYIYICLFIYFFFYLFICLFIYLFIYSFIYILICSLTRLFIYSIVNRKSG